METNIEASGYDLYDTGTENNLWLLCAGERILSAGDFRTVAHYAIEKVGIKASEIDVAVTVMVREGFNAAHFGAFKSFIAPHNKEFKCKKNKPSF